MAPELEWKLVYTKARCETWSEVNLRRQGFSVLMPRVRSRSGFSPLFPRYLFIGHEHGADTRPVRNTRGVQQLVHFGEHPARVPQHVIDEIKSRMDPQGVVHLDATAVQPLFDRKQQERVRTLVKLAQAGFRVVA